MLTELSQLIILTEICRLVILTELCRLTPLNELFRLIIQFISTVNCAKLKKFQRIFRSNSDELCVASFRTKREEEDTKVENSNKCFYRCRYSAHSVARAACTFVIFNIS